MSVTITLEQDEALVLNNLLASEKFEAFVDAPERNALWALECLLDKQLNELFSSDYTQLLKNARQLLLDRYDRSLVENAPNKALPPTLCQRG